MADAEAILEALKSEDDREVRDAAFRAGNQGLKEAVPALVKLFSTNNLGIQEAVEYALRKIRGATVVKALVPFLSSDDAPVRNLSMDILREIGTDDMDTLKQYLRDEDPDLRIFFSDILGSTMNLQALEPLAHALLYDPEVNVRYQAAMSLGNLGFLEAASALNKALTDEEWVQFSVIEALTKIKAESSIVAMVNALHTSSDLVTSMIVEALGEFGNIKAVPMLIKLLDRSPSPLRNKILQSIIKILGVNSLSLFLEKDPNRFKEYLLFALADEDNSVQDSAALGLSVLGGDDVSDAIFKKAKNLDPDRDFERLELYISGLVRIGISPALIRALSSKYEQEACLAVEVMIKIGSRETIEALKQVFWRSSREVQRAIVNKLGEVADENDTPFFNEVLSKHTDATVIKATLYFLGAKVKCKEAVPKMKELLEFMYNDVKVAALDACVAVEDPQMLAFFKARLNHSDATQRMMSIFALGRLGNIEDNLKELETALNDESLEVRRTALESLGKVRPISEERVRIMLKCLQDESSEVRLELIKIFGECYDTAYIPFFMIALTDSDAWIRIRALDALAALKVEEALPNIVALLEENNTLVSIKAIEALGEIGGPGAFRILLDILENGSTDLQFAAEEALDKINSNERVSY